MSWVVRSEPPERDDEPAAASPTPAETLEAERAALTAMIRRGVRSERQTRLLKRIAVLTRAILTGDGK